MTPAAPKTPVSPAWAGPSETYRRSEPGGKVSFVIHDLRQPFPESEPFDFVWVRFLLEYHRAEAFDIVKNCASILKPGGISLPDRPGSKLHSHYGISPRLEHAVKSALSILEKVANFDPYAGRKLYSLTSTASASPESPRMWKLIT
jgi:SAM-dependent methyltransferase